MFWARRTFAFVYFLGASSALALEVVWTRLMAVALGSAVEATACVLGAFMGGLGAGAWLAGALGDRIRRPLLAFAMLQVAGAIVCFLPYLAFAVGHAYSFAMGLLTVALAAFPLGMLFPLAARVRELDGTGRGSRSGILYALDTAGALAGCLVAGLVFIPAVGMGYTLTGACGLKLLVAIVALALPGAAGPEPVSVLEEGKPGRHLGVLLIVAVQGFALLGAEAVWSRLLSFVLYQGSTTYSFVAMLACVLGFASLGSFWSGRRSPSPDAAGLAILSGAGLLLSLLLLLVAGPVPSMAAVKPVDILVTVLACGPASFFSGAVFAAACRAVRTLGAAKGTGRVLAMNTLAAVAGALLVPLALVPLLGLAVTLSVLAMLQVLVAWGVSLRAGAFRPARLALPVLAIVAAILLCLAGPRWIRHLGEAVFYHEGRDVSVAVIEEQGAGRRLFVDGIAVAGTDLIMSTDQKTLAHLPVLLHEKPASVLTVGFGSGGTSHSLLLHPGIEVDCAEISPGVILAAPYLEDANHGLPERDEPRYHLHIRDARRYLAVTDRRYDIIVNDCTDLAYKSDAWLYTRDFFSLVRNRLNPGGIGAAWIPLRGERPFEVLRSVIMTFGAAFESISLWVFDAYPTHFGILVGGARAVSLDMNRVREVLANPAVRSDLASIGLDDPWRLATSRHLDDASLRAFSRNAALHSDDRPVVEFLAPLEHGDDASSYEFLEAAGRAPPVEIHSLDPADRVLAGLRIKVRPWLMAGHRAYFRGERDKARRLYLQAFSMSPEDPAPVATLGFAAKSTDLCRLAVIDYLKGDLAGSIRHVYAGLEQKSRDSGMLLCAAALDLAMGNRQSATERYLQILKKRTPKAIQQKALSGLATALLPWPFWMPVEALTFAGL